MKQPLYALSQRGFSMVEILIALLIVLTSIMGIASLLVRTVQQEVESSQRVEALVLLQDMVDRMNANRQSVACYSNGAAGLTLGTGFDTTSLPSPACQAMADADLRAWDAMLKGSAARAANGVDQGAMIGARGCIVQLNAAEQIYRVTVAWQGMGPTVAPPAGNVCGEDQYGDENLRRTVSAVVRIGDLS